MSEPKRYRVDIINVDPYHAELDDMGDRSGILPFVLAEDYNREHELRLQAERERDRLREHADRLAEAVDTALDPAIGSDEEWAVSVVAAYRKEFGE